MINLTDEDWKSDLSNDVALALTLALVGGSDLMGALAIASIISIVPVESAPFVVIGIIMISAIGCILLLISIIANAITETKTLKFVGAAWHHYKQKNSPVD
jgi:hypothetical protein